MILYIFVPGYYAAVEQADNALLRGTPVIVGGDPRKRGTVTAASAEARDAGIVAGMLVRDALAACPTAHVRPTRLRRYREVAQEFQSLLAGACERLEPDGLDGSYLEPPSGHDGVELGAELCVRVQAELGLRAQAGLGSTRFVAQLAARHAGPGGVRAVELERTLAFLAPFAVTELWGLGPATSQRLAEHGIATIGDLRALSVEALGAIVGRNASAFLQLARAQDRSQLRPRARAKSLSQEQTLAQPTVDLRTLGEVIGELAARLELQLRRERRAARTLALTLRYVDEHQVTRSGTPGEPLSAGAALRDAALELLGRAAPGVRAVRRVRLQLSNLERREASEDPRQLRLF